MLSQITILMPVYNGEKFITSCIQSILNQTFLDFKLLVINDGSSDNTMEELEKFKDKRIKIFVNKKNVGLTKSLNIGLRMISTPFIARMDVDDIAYPDRLKKQITFLNHNPEIGVVGTWAKLKIHEKTILKRNPITHDQIKVEFLSGNKLIHSSVMFRREVFLSNNLFYNPDFQYSQDFDLWYRASKITRLANIPEYLVEYYIHGNQITDREKDSQDKYRDATFLAIYRDLGFSNDDQTILRMHNSAISLDHKEDTDFKLIFNWFLKILQANRKKGVFHQRNLKSFLLSRLKHHALKKNLKFMDYLKFIKWPYL